jgi:hypothetical protein
MSSLPIIAQTNEEVHYYYLTEESYDLLKPTNIITSADKTLSLAFSQAHLTNYFADKVVLKIIAEGDGHKDYTEIETEDKRGITYISPNPASSTTQIGYLIAETDSGYLMVTNSVTGISHNFVIDNQTDSMSIPVQHLPTGAYVVNLVIGGVIIDAKHLIIQ